SWENRLQERLRLVLVPPGGGTPMQFPAGGPLSGVIINGFRLPLENGASGAGNWTLRVVKDSSDTQPTTFNLVLLGDDATVNTSSAVVGAEHVVGERIKLTVQVNDFAKTLKGLNTQAGAQIKA